MLTAANKTLPMTTFALATGYTLLELMVVIAIAGILAFMAVPGFKDSIVRNGRDGAMLDVMTAIGFARSEAVAQNKKVSICRSSDQLNCESIAGGDWDDGWIIFSDNGTSGSVDVGAGDAVIQVHGPGKDQSVITLKTKTNGNFSGDYIQFDKDGFLRSSSTGAYFKFCTHDNTLSSARAIWLSNTGRPALSTNDPDGVHNDLLGANLVCP